MRQIILGGLWGVVCVSALLTFRIRADAWAYESETVTNGATVRDQRAGYHCETERDDLP
jgi:hypothetical protein